MGDLADVWQGDLVLSGDRNYTIIGETFHINGSIVVTENATLFLRDATLNFTQARNWQFDIILRDPGNGRPRLIAYDSTITFPTTQGIAIRVRDNSTAFLSNIDADRVDLQGSDGAILNVSRSVLGWFGSWGPRVAADALDSTIHTLMCGDGTLSVRNSTVDVWLQPRTVNNTIAGLGPGFVEYWNYPDNCSVVGDRFTNLTIKNSVVGEWDFRFRGSSNVTMYRSTIGGLDLLDDGRLSATDSSLILLNVEDGKADLVNTTVVVPRFSGSGMASHHWYLDVHVIDSIGQGVPMAEVSAKFANGTRAGSAQSGDSGWARMVLLEELASGANSFPEEPYTATAKYETFMNEEAVEMAGNQELILQLSLVILELQGVAPALVALSMVAIVALSPIRRSFC